MDVVKILDRPAKGMAGDIVVHFVVYFETE